MAGVREAYSLSTAYGYCVGLITPASLAGDRVEPISRAQHLRQFGGMPVRRYGCVLGLWQRSARGCGRCSEGVTGCDLHD